MPLTYQEFVDIRSKNPEEFNQKILPQMDLLEAVLRESVKTLSSVQPRDAARIRDFNASWDRYYRWFLARTEGFARNVTPEHLRRLTQMKDGGKKLAEAFATHYVGGAAAAESRRHFQNPGYPQAAEDAAQGRGPFPTPAQRPAPVCTGAGLLRRVLGPAGSLRSRVYPMEALR